MFSFFLSTSGKVESAREIISHISGHPANQSKLSRAISKFFVERDFSDPVLFWEAFLSIPGLPYIICFSLFFSSLLYLRVRGRAIKRYEKELVIKLQLFFVLLLGGISVVYSLLNQEVIYEGKINFLKVGSTFQSLLNLERDNPLIQLFQNSEAMYIIYILIDDLIITRNLFLLKNRVRFFISYILLVEIVLGALLALGELLLLTTSTLEIPKNEGIDAVFAPDRRLYETYKWFLGCGQLGLYTHAFIALACNQYPRLVDIFDVLPKSAAFWIRLRLSMNKYWKRRKRRKK
jgi:hypothetical protein